VASPLQKAFRVGGNRRIQFQPKTCNLLDANIATGMDFRADPNFKRPSASCRRAT
jgi:hypothetical protein